MVKQIVTWVVVVIVVVGMLLFLITPAREAVFAVFTEPQPEKAHAVQPRSVELIHDDQGHQGLRLGKPAIVNLEINPVPAERAREMRPLPPQMGTVNYDSDYLYTIRPRFAGEMVSFAQVTENPYPEGPEHKRDLSFGDVVKPGQVLGVFWSKDLGMAKAALVDAIISKSLSEDLYRRQLELFNKGAISEAGFLQAEKQLRSDQNAYSSALRPLFVWKLPRAEIQEVEREARNILKDLKKPRDPEEEIKRWARVEIKAPVPQRDGKPDPGRELIVVEKNTSSNDFIDPGRDMPLFKLADLTRLQVWIHPPEEYLPMVRAHLNHTGPGLRLLAKFQADPPGTPMTELSVSRISPSLDPTLKTPMLIAELKNPNRQYLVGQFVTALIYVPPPPETVEVPTDAVNLVESQNLVFVRSADGKPNEYFLRRVAVAQTAGPMTLVRSKLTRADEEFSASEKAKGRRPLEALQPGEIVLTRGVVELTAALEDLVAESAAKKEP